MSQNFSFLGDGGEMGALVRSIDWANHPLGNPGQWPDALKINLATLFGSKQPMVLWWGEKLFQFYNDSFRDSLSTGKHPAAMGQRAKDCWPERWVIVGPQVEKMLLDGVSTWYKDLSIQHHRNGKLENLFWTYGYSPVRSADGQIQGILVVCTETTEEVHARHSLEESQARLALSEERLSSAIAVSRVGFFDWDMKNDHVTFSTQMQRDWGIPAGTPLRDIMQFIHAEDRERTSRIINEAIQCLSPFATEYRVRRPDGKMIWIEAKGEITFEPSGTPVRFFGTSIDITERKAQEDKAISSGQQLSTITDALPVLVSYIDTDHRYQFVNRAYERWFDTSQQSLLGKTMRECVGEAAYAKALPYLERAYAGEVVEFTEEAAYAGGVRQIQVIYTPDKAAGSDRVRGVIALVHDVTAQKAATKLLEASNQMASTERNKLEEMVRESPAAIGLMRGPELIFEIANAKWKELVSAREYIGKSYVEVYPELVDSPALHSIRETFATGKSFTVSEMKLLVTSPAGKLEDQYYDYTNIRILDGEGKPYGVYCHAMNITDRVLARIEAEEAAKHLASTINLLEQEREVRERFVATLTHDLRTPLTAAKMSAQLLKRKASDPVATLNLASRIIISVDRAEKMVRDLLDANLIKAGEGIPIEIAPCRLDSLAKASVSDLQAVSDREFKIEIHDGVIEGFWDCNALQRVIENLGGNAVKYGAPNTPVILQIRKNQSEVEIAVHNKGDPIPVEEQDMLFHPYRRATSALSSGIKGWGIGLVLVKGIAEAHGGNVSVSSSKTQGTTFTVKLPLDCRVLQ